MSDRLQFLLVSLYGNATYRLVWEFNTLVLDALQARSAFERKDFQKAETFLLRAERPELAAKFYKVRHTMIVPHMCGNDEHVLCTCIRILTCGQMHWGLSKSTYLTSWTSFRKKCLQRVESESYLIYTYTVAIYTMVSSCVQELWGAVVSRSYVGAEWRVQYSHWSLPSAYHTELLWQWNTAKHLGEGTPI